MDRIIVHFIDNTDLFVNVEGTDIVECGDYMRIYNGEKLVGVVLSSTIKLMYKTTRRD